MTKNNNPYLSIVVPSYNEKNSIEQLLLEYQKFCKKYDFELIFVNNGSNDETQEVLKQFSNKEKYDFVRVVNIKKNIGYGHGIMSGVRSAKADILAWTHADMQTHPSDVFRAFDLFNLQGNKQTIVKGDRKGRPFADKLISLCMGAIASTILRVPLYEINAQPKLFPKSFIPNLKEAPDDFLLDLFFLYKARKNGYKILSINVDFPKRKHGKSNWSYSLGSKLRMIKSVINYSKKLSSRS